MSHWHRVPAPAGDSEAFIRAINRATEEHGYEVVFGVGDAEVLTLPFRCQPMTVSGFTITSISRQFGKSRDRSTQSRRSVGRSEDRREFLFIVAS